MRLLVPGLLTLALAASDAAAQDRPAPPPPGGATPSPSPREDSPAPPTGEGVREALERDVGATEVRSPNRGQVYRTPGRHSLGDFEASFWASELVTFDDNLFLTEAGEESDFILTTTLGGRLVSQGSVAEVDLSVSVNREDYLENSEEDSNGGWIDGLARFGRDRGLFAVVSARALATDTTTATSLSTPGRPVLAPSNQIVRSYESNLGLRVGTRGEKTAVEASYLRVLTDNGRPLDDLNGIDHRLNLSLRRYPSPKTEVNLQAEATASRFTEDLNNDSDTRAVFL